MSTIKAVVADPNIPGRLAIREVEAPTPAPTEAVVRVTLAHGWWVCSARAPGLSGWQCPPMRSQNCPRR